MDYKYNDISKLATSKTDTIMQKSDFIVKAFIISFWTITSISCSHKDSVTEYYIFSKQDSLNSICKYDSNNNDYYPPPPPPPPPPSLEWYSNLVMIFDTAEIVYLYQTECIYRRIRLDDNHFYVSPSAYPNFIGLKPSQLLTLRADYLMEFLSDNDEIFRFDTNYKEYRRIFYIVSDFDTIKNPAYYKLIEHLKTSKFNRYRIFYIIRKSTEEERNVLSCKRISKFYYPAKFNWSSNFIDGKTKPFTNRYDSLESYCSYLIKSKDIFDSELTKLGNIE
jgi:hypothetical protein